MHANWYWYVSVCVCTVLYRPTLMDRVSCGDRVLSIYVRVGLGREAVDGSRQLSGETQ